MHDPWQNVGGHICLMAMPETVEHLGIEFATKRPHSTVFYLGEAKNYPDNVAQFILLIGEGLSTSEATVKGVEVFTANPATPDYGRPVVLILESESLRSQHEAVKSYLGGMGIKSESAFADNYRIHMTVGYLEEGEKEPDLSAAIGKKINFYRFHLNTGDGDVYWNMMRGKSLMPEQKSHDLVFFEERSTPKVVSSGMECKPKKGWGKQVGRRKATAEEERKISRGDWVRVDHAGNKPSDSGYKRTRHRPWLVKSDSVSVDFSIGNVVEWNSSGGRVRGKIKKKLTSGKPNEADGNAPQNASAQDPVYVIETDSGVTVQHHGRSLRRLATKGSRASLDRSPAHNWVEDAGGLPPYVREVARALERERGFTLSRAIATAINKMKRWARGGDNVTPKTQAQAARALAQWEAAKAKNGSKSIEGLLAFDMIFMTSETKGIEMQLETKSIAAPVEVNDEENGILTAYVSVTGVKDNVGDIIEPGAYKDTLAKRKPKGVLHHSWEKAVSKPLEVKELMPGDPELPKTLADGSPWPTAAGALRVKAQYNMKTEMGRDAFQTALFYGEEQEWSIGYNVPQGKAYKGKDGTRYIKGLDLFEYSQVLWGANSMARTAVGAKDAAASLLVEIKELFPDLVIDTKSDDEDWEEELDDDSEEESKKRRHPRRGEKSLDFDAIHIAWKTLGDLLDGYTDEPEEKDFLAAVEDLDLEGSIRRDLIMKASVFESEGFEVKSGVAFMESIRDAMEGTDDDELVEGLKSLAQDVADAVQGEDVDLEEGFDEVEDIDAEDVEFAEDIEVPLDEEKTDQQKLEIKADLDALRAFAENL